MVMNVDDISKATPPPQSRHVATLSHCGRTARSLLRRLSGHDGTTRGTVAKRAVSRRGLSDGAIAGTAVGVFIGVALLALCLYPVIVHQIKRRKRAAHPLDVEAGIQVQHVKGSTLGSKLHRRLSSTDSLAQNGELSRTGLGAGARNRELGWASANANLAQMGEGLESSRQVPTDLARGGDVWQQNDAATPHVDAIHHHGGHETAPFPFYTPASIPDDSPGVLKGTSDDYYRPSIPSSAFGMVAATDPVEPVTTSHRGSSLRDNLKQIFHRPSGRDGSFALVLSAEDEPTSSKANVGNELGQVPAPGRPTGSPTELPPTSTSVPQPFAPLSAPSPPADPAVGTVNPMDVMPASTQSEMRHRTEHQLSASSYASYCPPRPSHAGDQAHREGASTFTPPPFSALSPAEAAQAAQYPPPASQEAPKRDCNDVLMPDSHSHDHLSPSMIPERSRCSSFPSDHSTPFPGAHSTVTSTENTPSTQLDSPSPGSIHSLDFRQSASPQHGHASPQAGMFRCDEPGCSQAFDQPHKLKHHQRYHSKDHKCPYKDCGKGFGTKTHLQRHINDRHEKKKKFHCAIPGCDYSKAGGKAFPRKDNWKRHMTKIHGMDQQQLPEPIEADSEMGGA